MKQIKMSLETARKMWKSTGLNTGYMTSMVRGWLLENFTSEELEGKDGFTWEDSFNGSRYYIDLFSSIIPVSNSDTIEGNHNVFKTKNQAKSSLAFAQLTHVVAKYNEGKTYNGYCLWHIEPRGTDLCVFKSTPNCRFHLPFLNDIDTETSKRVNIQLWKDYWML